MQITTSSNNLREEINKPPELKKNYSKKIKKGISLQDDFIKNEIYKKLNEGSVLHFIRNSKKKITIKSNNSDSQKLKYELSMLKKYEENTNRNLSFISEFDLENEEKDNNSFNSSFDENSVEQIESVGKEK